MKIIFGLGNVGKGYFNTRHNIGFSFLDYLVNSFSKENNWNKGFLGSQIVINYEGEKLLLVKPSTFMNLSGDCVSKYVYYYKLSLDKILIVHDDLDISLGKYKLVLGKGPKGHNGLIDIENKLGSNKFSRLRIGIDNRDNSNIEGEDYVLNRFGEEELLKLDVIFEELKELVVKDWIKRN